MNILFSHKERYISAQVTAAVEYNVWILCLGGSVICPYKFIFKCFLVVLRRRSKNGGWGKCAKALNSGLAVLTFHIVITFLQTLAGPRLSKHKSLMKGVSVAVHCKIHTDRS